MEVSFSRETEIKLNEAAAQSGHATEDYVRELVERHIDEDAAFRDAVRRGFASLDHGDFIDETEMTARIEKLLHS